MLRPPPVRVMLIATVTVLVCAGDSESLTWNTSCAPEAGAGLPLMAPVLAFRVRPAGNAPLTSVQV